MIVRMFRARLPLLLFLLTLLSFLIAGSILMHLTLMNNLVNGDRLRIKTDFFELIFPKDWGADKVESMGKNKIIMINLVSADLEAILHLEFYDENATRDFMQKNNNFINISDTITLKIQELYNWSLIQNENATLFINDKGLMKLYGYEAYYMLVKISNGYRKNNIFYNVTCLFISLLIDNKYLFEIIFYGEEYSWEKNYKYFEEIINSIRIFNQGSIAYENK